jgi:nicotinate-nucleotide pyrophosphorylase (carboxylating)
MPQRYLIEEKLKEFLKEDHGLGDITSETLISDNQMAKAKLYYREDGVVAGISEAKIIFELLECIVTQHAYDGDHTRTNQTLIEVIGPARNILEGERVALNIVGRMAGIATITAQLVEKSKGKCRIAATRKTAPGLRFFDKKAVVLGGGDTHRFRLDDCVLIKDNHLALIPSIRKAVKKIRNTVSFTKKIEIEVRSFEEAEEAATAGADIIMLDNMGPNQIKDCLNKLSEKGLREGIIYEASGGISPEKISSYADSGVDIISLGYLTHSVRALDVKLEIEMT